MTLKEVFESKNMALLAVIGPAIAIMAITISIAQSPWFSFEDNALSDLGVYPVAPIFNSGLIICGVLCALFSVHMFLKPGRCWPCRIGIILIFSACVALVGIGIFTEDTMDMHMMFSIAFFVLLLLAALILTPVFLLGKETRLLGIIALLVVVIGVIGWLLADRWDGVAIPELLSVIPATIWLFVLGLWLYKKG